MSSDDSDDEPLSKLAAAKKSDPQRFNAPIKIVKFGPKLSDISSLKPQLTISLKSLVPKIITQAVVKRPGDVWLYLKDLNGSGPYSCLLCSDWFTNRPKMIIHYVLNHKKDFCGICRYFVPDREAWIEHIKFHTPWPCSQCVESFPTEDIMRNHLRVIHNLVHCRLCHFRLPVNENYDKHLYQKHNVTNVACIFGDLWDTSTLNKFLCLLCMKPDNISTTLVSHFMGYHHLTLKCLANLVSGKDPPFIVKGVDVSLQFIETELKGHTKWGYVDINNPLNAPIQDFGDYVLSKHQNEANVAIKQEILSDGEENKFDSESSKTNTTAKSNKMTSQSDDLTAQSDDLMAQSGEMMAKADDMIEKFDENDDINLNDEKLNDETIDYPGIEDFDVTLTELILLEECYYDYIDQTLNSLNNNTVPDHSFINYQMQQTNFAEICSLCSAKFDDGPSFAIHMNKAHSIKVISSFSCRICSTTFDSPNDLLNHTNEELGDFEDLWICQFCDKEFDNREKTRNHLSMHWNNLELDNCFSPHLGFKCKFCPMLFWNEPDREIHQIDEHLRVFKDQFYKCVECSQTFGDKIWFVHHFIQKHNQTSTSFLMKCSICCAVLTNMDDMRKHFFEDHPEARKLFCSLDTCVYKPLSSRKSFKIHIKAIHSPAARKGKDGIPEKCHLCNRVFATARACSTHITQQHGTTGKFKCKLCNDLLQTVDERKLHYLLRHPGRHPFECNECGKSFQYKSSLYMHKQNHQPNKQGFTCSYCGKVFTKKDSYREHIQIHEGPRHACSYCPMRFVQRSNMLRHERRHTGERPYQCPHCEKTFADKGACTSHARTHSRDTSYACIYCGQTFVQKSKLTYHIRKHTGENLETCTVCSKLFTSACSLREHMKTHVAKEENVKCPLCEKKYPDERYMLRHLRVSHTNTQYSCPICRKVITSSTGLRHHVMTHSETDMFQCKLCTKSYAVRRTMLRHLRKRHSLNSQDVKLKDYYKKRDPRECDLKLDEETMTSIFGPPKRKTTEVLVGDFVTFSKSLKYAENVKPNNQNSDEEEDSHTEDVEAKKPAADETEQNEYELEPTDFVSIKIEPLDDEGDSS